MLSIEIAIIILVSILLVTIFGFIIYIVIKKKQTNHHSNKLKLVNKKANNHYLEKTIKQYEHLKSAYEQKLKSLDHFDHQQLKKEVIKQVKSEQKQLINQELDNLKQEANLQAANILVDAMQAIVEPIIQENSTTIIKIDDDQIKGKIIGKEGRNKKSFELLTGVELIIDKDTNLITISSHNPIRREKARKMLERMLKAKAIDSNKIESLYKEVSDEFEKELLTIGKDVVENKLDIHDLNNELYPYIGRLKFRSSFGQNTLNHIIECTSVAKYIAHELKLDEKMAMKCALLHDIGKSLDYELNTNHVDVGIKIAKQLKLDPIIINAIESHHNNVVANNIYSEITKIADTISAARPGARMNSSNEYFQRVEKLENIINEFNEVNQTYVLKAGRYIRVIVNPILIKDQELRELALKIKNKIESDELTKGYNIKVCLIKENKYEFETENKLI